MQEELITFETAKLAKEKGFNIPCENFYIEYLDDDVVDLYNYEEQRGSGFAELYRNNKEFKFSAPTQSLLQRWLRESHNIEVFITPTHLSYNNDKSYKVEIEYFNGKIHCFKYDSFKEYEEALEIGLQEALKLI